MSLKRKHEDENNNINNENIISLGNEQIKSVLKTQAEAVFQDKNISNNSNFVKKSLIDIALDFETKQEKEKNLENEAENVSLEKIDTNKLETELAEGKDKTHKNENLAEYNETILPNETKDKKDLLSSDQVEEDIDLTKDESSLDISNNHVINANQYNKESTNQKLDDDNNNKIVLEPEVKKDEEILIQEPENNNEETQQALNSVRDAVSQSINKSDNETIQTSEKINPISDVNSETIIKDIENFKSIFSSLSNISEKAIYDVMENKILDIANELAGYQIDKMPEKYEKKIKAFLKNINCFEEKITIEVNDKDLEALSKIENFKNINQKSQFLPNKDISRGDIILNCDGMHYSEKTLKKD